MTTPLCQTPQGVIGGTMGTEIIVNDSQNKQIVKTAASVANDINKSIDLEVSSIGFGQINN